MDWNNTNNLLQAALVCVPVVMFVLGFHMGNKE